MVTTCGSGITAAAATRITHHLFDEVFELNKSLPSRKDTQSPPIALARIVKVSRLLRPVGPGLVSKNPSPGYCSHNPY